MKRSLESTEVYHKKIYKKTLSAKMLNLVLSLPDHFLSF